MSNGHLEKNTFETELPSAPPPKLAPPRALPVSVDGNSVLPVAQTKASEPPLTPLFLCHHALDPSANPLGSTFTIYPETDLFATSLVQATILSHLVRCRGPLAKPLPLRPN